MNLVQYFENQVEKDPEKVFLIEEQEAKIIRQLTYREVYETAKRVAGNLLKAGIRVPIYSQDRVAIVLPNSPELVMVWLGINWLGAVACPLEAILAKGELESKLDFLEPRLVINESNIKDFTEREPEKTVAIYPAEPRQAATIIQSSGTTGEPKGVVESHFNYILAGEGYCYWMNILKSDRLYSCLSFARINAQAYTIMGSIAAGATAIIGSKFERGRNFWQKICATEATVMNLIGNMIHDLDKQPVVEDEKKHSVRIIANALAIPDADFHQKLEQRFGSVIVIMYGSTEQLFGAVMPLTNAKKGSDCVGKPKTHPRFPLNGEFMAMILRENGSCVTQAGEIGELYLRSPFITHYWKNPALTAKKWGRHYWYRTGDYFAFDDDGYLYYKGREGEAMRRGGNWIGPREIESVLLQHPKIADAAVIGLRDTNGEEHVKAVVMPVAETTITSEELIEFCKEKLTIYKIPDQWEFVAELFRTPTERVQKNLLR